MKKLASLIAVSFIFVANFAVLAKDSADIEKKSLDQDSQATRLREKENSEKFKASEAMDAGHKDSASKYAKRAAKTARIAKKHEQLANKLNKKAEKLQKKEER
jgi:hypothetical protein